MVSSQAQGHVYLAGQQSGGQVLSWRPLVLAVIWYGRQKAAQSGATYGLVYDPPGDIVAPSRGAGEGINQAEHFAASVMAWSAPGVLHETDIICFLDNTSAESALVKLESSTASMSKMAQQAFTFLLTLRASVWCEWVPTDDNPADGLVERGGSVRSRSRCWR